MDLHEGPPELFDFLAWLKEQPPGELGLSKRMTEEQRAWYVVAARRGFATPGQFWAITDLGKLALRRRRELAEEQLRRPAMDTPQAESGLQPRMEHHIERIAQAVGDDNAARILAIASRKGWAGERKMEEILRLDRRFAGKESAEWASLLGVSAAAVRGYGVWKQLRAKQHDD